MDTLKIEELLAMDEAQLNALAAQLEDQRRALQAERAGLASVRDQTAKVEEWTTGVAALEAGEHPDKESELTTARGMLTTAENHLRQAQQANTSQRTLEAVDAEYGEVKTYLGTVNAVRQDAAIAREKAAAAGADPTLDQDVEAGEPLT